MLSRWGRKNENETVKIQKAYYEITSYDSGLDSRNSNNNDDDNNLLVDLSSDVSKPAVKEVTMGDALEYFEDLGLEYNVDYKDNSIERATGRSTWNIDRKRAESASPPFWTLPLKKKRRRQDTIL